MELPELTITAIVSADPARLVDSIRAEGLALDAIRRIDLAGLQLLLSVFLTEEVESRQYLSGRLETDVAEALARSAGLAAPGPDGTSGAESELLAGFWRRVS